MTTHKREVADGCLTATAQGRSVFICSYATPSTPRPLRWPSSPARQRASLRQSRSASTPRRRRWKRRSMPRACAWSARLARQHPNRSSPMTRIGSRLRPRAWRSWPAQTRRPSGWWRVPRRAARCARRHIRTLLMTCEALANPNVATALELLLEGMSPAGGALARALRDVVSAQVWRRPVGDSLT